MREHTPGPWRADFSSESVRVRAPDGSGVCTINWLSAKGHRDGNEGEANARLIAAAPALLAALEAVRDHLRTGKWEQEDGVDNVLSAVISEARGCT